MVPTGFNYSALPSLAALAVLVAVFRSISHRESSDQLKLWLTGWVLVLVHFVAQFMDVGEGIRHYVWEAIGLDTLVMAGIAFLISVSFESHDRWRRGLLAIAFGGPALAYLDANLWNVNSRVFYTLLIVLTCSACTVLICEYYRRISAFLVGLLLALNGLGLLVIWLIIRGHAEAGGFVILFAIYTFVALFYWRNRRRATAGILTTTLGFVAWGSVFPIGLLAELKAPTVHFDPEIWNLPKYFVAVGMILTLLEEQVDENQHLAYHDALTGLPNRRLLADRVDQAIASAQRAGSKVAVLVLDLDTFKEVNDSLGHRIGDVVLKRTVERLSTRIRAADTLARSGGDEFTVISEVSDAAGAEALANGLVSVLHEPFIIEEHVVTTGVSIGIALFPDHARNPDDLRAAADKTMYEAKRAGRNRYLLSDSVHTP